MSRISVNSITKSIRRKFAVLRESLTERQRRHWAASEARELGHGGVSLVRDATGLARSTIHIGLKELHMTRAIKRQDGGHRSRKTGGGRRAIVKADPSLLLALDELIEPLTRGDPQSPLRWTCKSTANLAAELTAQHHQVSARTVATLLKAQMYSLQANRKTREGRQHPDRNAQFEYINRQVKLALHRGQPAISVDTKKKEKIGNFKNGGLKENRSRRTSMISLIPKKARLCLMVCTILLQTTAGSMSGLTTIRQILRLRAFIAGG